MRNWIQKNLKNIIVGCFIIPILLVAFVSISHVTSMYELSNPFVWSVYLSVGIEIAALSALAAVSVKMGRFVYLPFLIVTIIQFLGNMFSVYSEINETSVGFKNWVDLIGPLFEPMGIELTDIPAQKRILAFFTGGLLPIISLTFAHMLVVFTENHKESTNKVVLEENELEAISKDLSKWEQENEVKDQPEPLSSKESYEKMAEIIETKFINNEEQPIQETIPDDPNNSNDIKVLTYSKNHDA